MPQVQTEESDPTIRKIVSAVKIQFDYRSQSANLRKSLNAGGIRENENEFSFREKSEVDQSFIDVQSSLLKSERPRA